MSGSSSEPPNPLPILNVEPAVQMEKGEPPEICPLCHGGLSGAFLTQTEEAVERWEEQRRPRKHRRASQQLRRMPYRYRWLPRKTREQARIEDSRPY